MSQRTSILVSTILASAIVLLDATIVNVRRHIGSLPAARALPLVEARVA